MGFKDAGFLDRQQAAAKAKQAALEKFRAQPGPGDPEFLEREQARKAVIEAREKRSAEREAARIIREKELAEQRVRDALAAEQAAKEAAERAEQERRDAIEREKVLEGERKADRDARYAARKERQRKKR